MFFGDMQANKCAERCHRCCRKDTERGCKTKDKVSGKEEICSHRNNEGSSWEHCTASKIRPESKY